jgi:Flp pilus assembly protein TadD
MLRRGKLSEAASWARRAVTSNPADAHSHNHEASVLLASGDTARALASSERALRLEPTLAVFLRKVSYLRAWTAHEKK